MNLKERLVRNLSFANVVACLALFVALGGSAYAASKINGSSIVNHSIGAGKLKNGTLTSAQVKKGSLNGSVINSSSLGTVPAAQTATTAASASKAGSAERAGTAKSAETAKKANSATTAASATHAGSADSATHASTADSATHATSADTADSATEASHATDADTLGGQSAADLTVSCPDATELYGGMCWDEEARPLKLWIGADIECAEVGGRLPSIGELVGYIARPGPQFAAQAWSGDLDTVKAGEDEALASDETARAVIGTKTVQLGFRCVFHQTNG